jgi:hypothetical protein
MGAVTGFFAISTGVGNRNIISTIQFAVREERDVEGKIG